MSQDAELWTLACTSCGNSESSRVKDRGGVGVGNHINWDMPRFAEFRAAMSGGGVATPNVSNAVCGRCGNDQVSIQRVNDWP